MSPTEAQLFGWLTKGSTIGGAINQVVESRQLPRQLVRKSMERLLRALVEGHLLHRPKPRNRGYSIPDTYLHVYLTRACNLRCPHCYMDGGAALAQELDAQSFLSTIREFHELGGRLVTLSGGEPLMRDDFFMIAEETVQIGCRCFLFTNGTSIQDRVQAERVAAVCDAVQVSIDGASREMNDSIRGRGTFDMALGAARLLNSAGARVRLGITVMRSNVRDIQDNWADLLKTIGSPDIEVRLGGFIYTGRGLGSDDGLAEDIVEQISTGLTLSAKDDAQFSGWGNPGMRNRSCLLSATPTLDSNGDIYSCVECFGLLGNVRESTLRSLLQSLFDRANEMDVTRIPCCRDCDFRFICGAGLRLEEIRKNIPPGRLTCTEAEKRAFLWRMVRGYVGAYGPPPA
jgi:radical SAM protein with 4Fe4S-binding SPASM domain